MLTAATCKCDRPIETPDGCQKCGKPTAPPKVYRPTPPDAAELERRAYQREASRRRRERMSRQEREEAAAKSREWKREHEGTKTRLPVTCVSDTGRFMRHRFTERASGLAPVVLRRCLRCGVPNPQMLVK